MELLIAPGSRLVGRILGKLRLRRRYGVYPLAVHRRGRAIAPQLDAVRLAIGDTLLIEGPRENIQKLIEDAELIDLTRDTKTIPLRRSLARIFSDSDLSCPQAARMSLPRGVLMGEAYPARLMMSENSSIRSQSEHS